MDPLPRRLVLASRVLFYLSGVLIAAGVVCMAAGVRDADEITARLLERILAEIDAETLARLPPDFLTSDMVRQAALALGFGFLVVGFAQLATAIGLRRGTRWSYAAAVVGGLFVAFTCGATAAFMLAATSTQPQAATLLVLGAIGLGSAAVLYGAIAVGTAAARRELEASRPVSSESISTV